MKILHITQSAGGVKTYIDSVVKLNPDSEKYEHFLACSSAFVDEENLFKERFIIDTFVRSIHPKKDLLSFLKLRNVIKQIKPDAIHCHSAKGGFNGRILGFLYGIPTIYTPHAFSYLCETSIKKKVFLFLEQITRLNSYLLAVSKSEELNALNRVGYSRKKIYLVNNFTLVPEKLFRDYRCRSKVGMIGRLTYQKNPLLFLEIARKVSKEIPDIKFVLLGAGIHDHLIEQVNAFINLHQLNSHVIIDPWRTYKNVRSFYDDIDIFLLTSVYEGMSFSLLEAMAEGLPVAVTDVEGNKDVVNSENGIISNSPDTLSNAIIDFLKHSSKRAFFGEKAYKHVKLNHNLQNAEDIYRLYDFLVYNSKSR